MSKNELFIADDLLKACQGWQEVIDSVGTPEEKIAASQMACASLRSIKGFRGTRKVIVQSELALVLKDPPQEEVAIKYRDVTAKGWLGQIVYVDMVGYNAISWPLYDTQMFREPEIETPDERNLAPGAGYGRTSGSSRPIYLPVGFIDYALLAA